MSLNDVNKFIASETPKETKQTIFARDLQYFTTKTTPNGIRYDHRLTNFIIRIVSSHYRDDGIYREITFLTEGKESARKMIAPTDMFDGFKSFLASCGNYCFWGTTNDLTNIWAYLYSKDEGKVIYEPECIGWQEDKNIFMFENIAFHRAEQLQPDAHGTFWLNGVGVKPRNISASKNDVPEGIPYLVTNKTLDIQDLRKRLHQSMDATSADQCLGWSVSVLYMEEIFNLYGNFPFLFLSGKRKSGKSTIAIWLMHLFGFEEAGRMWSDTTPVAMSRYLGYYSSLPLWLDEYRNDSKYANKTGMLRNVYNRQSSGKGTRDGFTIREAKIRGTVIISGEETPDDNALMTRCIVIQMSERNRSTNNFNWFTDNRALLSNFTYQILSAKHQNVETYIKKLHAKKAEFSQYFDDRLAINKAIVATGFEMLYGIDESFNKSLLSTAFTDSESQEEESPINVFFNDVAGLVFSKAISENYWSQSEGYMYIYFHGLYNEWAIDYRKRRGEPPFKLQSLRSYLTEEEGFVDLRVNHRMNDGSVRSCVKFQIDLAPEYVTQLLKN